MLVFCSPDSDDFVNEYAFQIATFKVYTKRKLGHVNHVRFSQLHIFKYFRVPVVNMAQ